MFSEITDHCIIKVTNSIYELIISWWHGSVTWGPVSMMRLDYPIYLDKYVCDHDILDNSGWKKLTRYVNNTKTMNRLLKSAKAKQRHNTAKIRFGLKISHDHK